VRAFRCRTPALLFQTIWSARAQRAVNVRKAVPDTDPRYWTAMLIAGVFGTVLGDALQHLARDAYGRTLWERAPYADAGVTRYREAHPTINFVNEPTDRQRPDCARMGWTCAELGYTSTQFGLLNLWTGEFRFLGQA
jgi:hypothetical protein